MDGIIYHITSALISTFGVALWAYKDGMRLTPDGLTALSYAGGTTPCAPFHTRVALPYLFRWLVPGADGSQLLRVGDQTQLRTGQHVITIWRAVTLVSVALSGYLIGVCWGPVATALFIFSPWARLMVAWYTTQTDQPALVFAMLAILLPPEYRWAAVVVGGLFHERVPVLAALFTGDPWGLIAFTPVYLFLKFRIKSGVPHPHEASIVTRPWASAREANMATPLHYYVVPLALFWFGLPASPLAILGILIAYGQCLIAWDRLRLFGWATLALLPGTVQFLGEFSLQGAGFLATGLLLLMHLSAETRRV